MQRESTYYNRPLLGDEPPEIHRFHESRLAGAGRAQEAGAVVGEARNAIRATTISEVENLEHFPSDQELLDYMQARLVYKQGGIHEYWVYAPATVEDRRDLELPALAGFYGSLADFIESRVGLVDISPEPRSALELGLLQDCLDSYSARIAQKVSSFCELAERGDYPSWKDFQKDFVFDGLNIRLKSKVHDLCRDAGWPAGLMSNIHTGCRFIRYWTEAMAHQKVVAAGKELPLHYRIYLNPTISKTPEIAGQLSDAFERENLHVINEIMNRPYDFCQRQGRISGVGTEGITVYCNKYHANGALAIILKCFESNYDLFEGRPCHRLATPVAPGIAVTAHEGFETTGYSYDFHRSNIIADAWEDFSAQHADMASTVPHQAVHAFKQVLEAEFRKHQINPRNISFKDSSVASDIL